MTIESSFEFNSSRIQCIYVRFSSSDYSSLFALWMLVPHDMYIDIDIDALACIYADRVDCGDVDSLRRESHFLLESMPATGTFLEHFQGRFSAPVHLGQYLR